MHVLDIFNESDRNFLNGVVSEADIGSQNLEAWKQKVQAAYPQERGRIMFVSKDNGKVVSAEIPGLDRSFGVFDMDTEQGQVLGEAGQGRNNWDSNMPGYQGDYGGAENWDSGKRAFKRHEADQEWEREQELTRQREEQQAQLAQYNETGKFWLKLKDSQRHLPSGPFTGKQAANAAAVELLKKQPDLKGNLVITARGPEEQDVAEGVDTEELANEVYAEFEMMYPNLARRADERTIHAAILDVLNYGGDNNAGALAQDVARAVKQQMSQGVAEGAALKKVKREYNQAAKDAGGDWAGAGKTIDNMKKSLRQKDVDKKAKDVTEGNMKPTQVSGTEQPGAVEMLEKALVKAKDRGIKLDYDAIDKMMQLICKKHNLTGDKLHDDFVSKHKTVPDNWIKKQDVTEGYDGEYDDEAGMAESNLLTTARAVKGLLDTIEDRDNLPEWVQEKIAKAEAMLVSSWDYLQSQKEQGRDPKIGSEDEINEEKQGLWANIHAKRKRGDKMRKPGSKGAPTDADFKAARGDKVSEGEWDGTGETDMAAAVAANGYAAQDAETEKETSLAESEITEEMIADRLNNELALFKSGTKSADKTIGKRPVDREVQSKDKVKKSKTKDAE